tara:strand:+ start:39 stop:599 length:561 start_codon:yes stop_codon:yes gene_type:complete
MPEALLNFRRLICAAERIQISEPILIFVALGSEPSLEQIQRDLFDCGYRESICFESVIGDCLCMVKDGIFILVGPHQFSNWASWAELGIATAGTATEQLVGLGIPALSLPGKGPQFTKEFAIRQSRLLGGAVLPCFNENRFSEKIEFLLQNKLYREKLGSIGVKRMGPSGGSFVLASLVSKLLIDK